MRQSCRAESVSTSRRGLTLIELLVVLGLVFILFMLIVPSIQQQRMRGRRPECLNNLKNIALAANNYAIANLDCLPPLLNPPVNVSFDSASVKLRHPNWPASLLAYLDRIMARVLA